MAIEKTDDAYQLFERLDEEQIADEIQGVYARTLVYQFEGRDGRMVTGLSIKGVYEVAKSLVRHGYDVTCEEAKITGETETEYRASCKAMFKAPNGKTLTTYGYSKANKFYSKGNPSEFAYVQALSKAQRNALRTLIPEKFAAKCVEEFLAEKEEGRVKKITSKAEKPVEKPVETELTLPRERKVMLRFLKNVPQIVGVDMKAYGPFKAEDVGTVPEVNASSLVENGFAERIDTDRPVQEEAKAKEGETVQDLVGSDKKKYGTISLAEGEIKVVFDPPIPYVPSVIDNFLVKRILDVMVAKAKTEDKFMEYQLDENESGVKSVHMIGDVSEKNFKDLVSPCLWAAKTATEKKT